MNCAARTTRWDRHTLASHEQRLHWADPSGHAVVHGEGQVEGARAATVLAIGNWGIHRTDYGVRAEDTIWISPDGPVELTRSPKNRRTRRG